MESSADNTRQKIATIVLPINVHNVHWYVAFLKLDKTGVKLNIQNNIELRDKMIEAKLMEIGRRYHQKMWDKLIPQKNQKSLITPTKETQTQIQSQKRQIRKKTFLYSI